MEGTIVMVDSAENDNFQGSSNNIRCGLVLLTMTELLKSILTEGAFLYILQLRNRVGITDDG